MEASINWTRLQGWECELPHTRCSERGRRAGFCCLSPNLETHFCCKASAKHEFSLQMRWARQQMRSARICFPSPNLTSQNSHNPRLLLLSIMAFPFIPASGFPPCVTLLAPRLIFDPGQRAGVSEWITHLRQMAILGWEEFPFWFSLVHIFVSLEFFSWPTFIGHHQVTKTKTLRQQLAVSLMMHLTWRLLPAVELLPGNWWLPCQCSVSPLC